jgi:hypothetical protein
MATVLVPNEATRARNARTLCRKLSAEIALRAPPGLGTWEPAWEIVERPSAEFLDRLSEWVKNGHADTLDAIRKAYREVVEAWATARDAWEAAGRPRRCTGSVAAR